MKLEIAPQDVIIPDNFEKRDIAVGNIAMILDLLADKIYTDKELAVVRELSCNAYDSHIVAGTSEIPFDIHLPTMLEPWFCIRDYGTGLEDNEITEVYSAIGVSTKRNSNELIGMFGIGSLSPYSICDSFTVRSFKNGEVRTYQCMRDEQRIPKVIPLQVSSTDEPNGLEITLSVSGKIKQFEEAAKKAFKFWEGVYPNINNKDIIKECEEQKKSYVLKGDCFGLTNKYGNMVAIMGGIQYKIPYDLDEFNCYGYLKFDLGELEFDTARENLSVTDKVREKISEKFSEVKQKLAQIAIDQVEQQPTKFTKAVLADKLSQGQVGRFVGDSLKDYRLPKATNPITYWKRRYSGCETYKTEFVPVGGNVEYYVHKDRMTSRIRSYIKDYDVTVVVFKSLQEAIDCGVDVDVIKDLDDLPKIETVRRSNSTSKVNTFVFTGFMSNSWEKTELEIDGSEIVYLELNRDRVINCNRLISGNTHTIQSNLELLEDYNIVVPKVYGLKSAFLKTKKFKSGNFITFDDYVVREFSKLSDNAVYHRYNDSNFDRIEAVNSVCDCEEAASIVENKPSNDIGYILFKLGVQVEHDHSFNEKISEFLDKYSMLTILCDWEIKSNKEKIAKYLDCKVK